MTQQTLSKPEVEDTHGRFETTVGYFTDFLEGLDAYRDEGKFVIANDSVYSQVVHPSNVAMCVARVKGKALNHINTEGKDKQKYAVNFERVTDRLSGVGNSNELEVVVPIQADGTYHMKLNILSEDMEILCPLVDKDDVPSMPNRDVLSHKNRIVVDGTTLKKCINHSSEVVNEEKGSIVFMTEEDVFRMIASHKVEGRFTKDFHPTGPSDEIDLGNHTTEVAYRFLNDIKQVIGSSDEVEIHIKDSNPIRFDLNLDSDGDAKILYIIAPRVKD